MKNIIIGLAGQAASGKDTTAKIISHYIDEYLPENQSILIKHFAYNVKKIFCDYFNVDVSFIEEWKRIPTPPPEFLMPVRQSLQMIGDGFRKVKPTVWIDKALQNPINIILADCRYVNEAKAIKEKGGFVVVIDRPTHRNNDPNNSEKEIGQVVANIYKSNVINYPFDYFLINDGSIYDLDTKVQKELLPVLLKTFT